MAHVKPSKLPSTQAMLATNTRQREFYESRYEATAAGNGTAERAANRPTRAWTRLRRRLQRLKSAAGVYTELRQLHRTWLGDLRHARVLDLGCFTGNPLTLWLAESAAEYVGIDLSESAIAELDRKLSENRFTRARAIAMDFLSNDWPDGHFEVVYAHSVLHHFANIEAALAELCRVVKPGGIIVTLDPLSTDPLNRLARAVYRPFQTDRDWEFPFTAATLRAFGRYFEIEDLRGLEGAVKLAYPLLLLPGLEPIGHRVAARLRTWDFDHARSPGMPLNLCWHVTMKLRCRPAVNEAQGPLPIAVAAGQ